MAAPRTDPYVPVSGDGRGRQSRGNSCRRPPGPHSDDAIVQASRVSDLRTRDDRRTKNCGADRGSSRTRAPLKMWRSPVVFSWIALNLITGLASATTYHIRADGTASKATAVSCGSSETAMSVSTANGVIFSPGDRIILCSEGGVFRTTLYLSSGGAPGQPITYDGRQTAVLSGSDLVTGWTSNGGDTYVAAISIQPQQVFFDGEFGDRKSGLEELTDDLDWYWESGSLYVFLTAGNPDTVFADPGVEAGAREACFGVGQADHVIVQGLTVRHSNHIGVLGWIPGSHLTVRNVVAEWNWHTGFSFDSHFDPVNVPYDNLTIENNTARFNGTGGIELLGPSVDAKIHRNTCYENGKYQSRDGMYNLNHEWTFGIKLWENSPGQEGTEIYFNECYDNGRGNPGDNQGRGVGIWLDGIQGNPENPTAIRFNKVRDNTGNGIFLEISSNTVVQSNVLYNNATNTDGVDGFAPANIAIDARWWLKSENNRIFNNTSYGGRYGVKIVTYAWQGCSVDNNLVMNNIIVEAAEHNLYCNFGGDNDGVNGSGNVYEYNNLGEERPGMVNWGNLPYDTYAEWETVYGQASHSVEGEPQLLGTTHDKLVLTSSSPCRDTGSALGEPFEEALRETSYWTDFVRTDRQDALGSGWEIGAFGYTGQGPPLFADGFEIGTVSRWSSAEP